MMRYSQILVYVLVCIPFWLRGAVDARQAIASGSNQIASAFNYPVTELRFDDKTEEARRRNGENADSVFAVFSVTGKGRTFAPLSLVVYKEHTLLTDALKGKIRAALDSASREGATNISISRLEIPGVGSGYSGLGAAGPGGEEQMALLHMPAQGFDVQARVYLSADPPLEVNELSKAYHDALGKSGFLRMALESCLKSVAANITEVKTSSIKETNRVSDISALQPGVPISQAPSDAKPTQSQTRSIPFGWLAFGIMIVVAIAFGLSRKK